MDRNKAQAGIWGVLVGDALGVPHEFKDEGTIAQLESIEMVISEPYPKTFPKVPYGTWSDDGSLTLAFADSLGRCKGLDLDDLGASMGRWFNQGEYTPDGYTYDVGNTTMEALLRIQRGHPAATAGLTHETANGNGSLMRTLPLALVHQGSDEELYRDAGLASAVTHGHDVSKAACGIYCVVARHLLHGADALTAVRTANALRHVDIALPKPTGTGYVLDSLSFALLALLTNLTYENAMRYAISLGTDTDTTAAIAGGLIALRDGLDCIPVRWLAALRGKEVAIPIIERLLS